ncbi:hypothetical protein HanOQP8_Chr09g0338141 [Helianthus annuus]|nr:hypothetical protein HanOQP8_Chr09g0338141 [Helianthus annuus]
MASVRLIRLARPPSAISTVPPLESVSGMRFTCMAAGFGSENTQLAADMERKPVALPKVATYTVADLDGAVVEVEPTQTISEGVDVATLMAFLTRRRQWNLIIQSLVEKIIVDSRFFTMFGVAGTLLGSVLCFLEGVFLVVESYLQYFHALYHHSNHGHIMDLLIKALGASLTPIVLSKIISEPEKLTRIYMFSLHRYVLSGNGYAYIWDGVICHEFPSWAGIKSISQAKSKIGHALMLLLQVGVLEKFKSIPLVTGLDLACFAAAVFVSSAGLFILSRLSTGTNS